MKHVDAYLQTGKPIIGMRPSVVAFRNKPSSQYVKYSDKYRGDDYKDGFGRQVLGATWIAHHGHHGVESTLGIPIEAMKAHPIMRGVGEMWGPTDLYTVSSPIPHDGKVLVMGQVLKGMKGTAYSPKIRMPLAWVKDYPTANGDARVFMSTMGDAQDFLDENFRRMVVNACFWSMKMEAAIAEETNVDFIGSYDPSPFGFGKFRKGLKPAHYLQTSAKDSVKQPQLTGQWRMDDGEGITIDDATKGNHDGQFLGAANGGQWLNDPTFNNRTVLQFNGNDNGVKIGLHGMGANRFKFDAAFTIAFWVKTAQQGEQTGGLIGKHQTLTGLNLGEVSATILDRTDWESGGLSDGVDIVCFSRNNSNTASTAIHDGKWHHIALCWEKGLPAQIH